MAYGADSGEGTQAGAEGEVMAAWVRLWPWVSKEGADLRGLLGGQGGQEW